MATFLPELKECGEGDKCIAVTGRVWDSVIQRLNLLSNPTITPPMNCGTASVGKAGLLIDLYQLDQRIQKIADYVGINTAPGSSNSTQIVINNTTTVTFTDVVGTLVDYGSFIAELYQNDEDFNNRLANATANSVCVGNVVVTTFNI